MREADYLGSNGELRVDRGGTEAMHSSLLYKLSYHRFGQVMTEYGKPYGWDRVRDVEIGSKDFELDYLQEVYTSSNWIVRVYKVHELENRW